MELGHPSNEIHGVDPLSGVASRDRLVSELEQAAIAAEELGRPMALLFIDLNDFKLVNDSLGHAVGDELLRQVARRLQGSVRAGELLARVGGDEFVLLVRELVPPSVDATPDMARIAAAAIGHRLTAVLETPFTLEGVELLVDAGVGASILPLDAAGVDELRRHADAAMYQAKSEGASVVVYSDATPDPIKRLETAARLRRAIERDELVLHYQPIVALDLDDSAIVGVEALVRWEDPDRGLVPPNDFIPVAESTGVISALGDWVLEELCEQAQRWAAEGLYPNFGYNVSPRQLQRADFAATVFQRVASRGLDPGRFVLELTETAWSLELSRIQPTLETLRASGLALAIDDFGAGYSSLWRLRELPVQVIKIDRALLRGVPGESEATAVVSAILALADACGCDVVAEGVETDEQRRFLAGEGCRLAQGFHFSRPLPVDRITDVLRASLAPHRRAEPHRGE